ncbi:sphingomyelin phosphodiesterase [Hyalella azteca]|uniref:Sphingomyelin phosphodiesterase n=1 Tax=Hyalella azteca TaxID=294128 RepID=A0A8B7P921_HYAAZ|nr:sphingomyelin phosphodiesterase [Hyalella azteca]
MEYVIRRGRANHVQLCALIFTSSYFPTPPCGLQFQDKDWSVDIPVPIPTGPTGLRKHVAPKVSSVIPVEHRRAKSTEFSNEGRPYLKVLHLADLHYDPSYREGSSTKCGAPICCQAQSGSPMTGEAGAGRWGDYGPCDSPEILVRNMLEDIRRRHSDIDYIIYTGDSVAHDLWKLSREKNTKVINKVGELLKEYFPYTPIVGALGNHESFPRDSFPPPEDATVNRKFSNLWLYNLMADQWQSFLPNVNISTEARISGSYSVLIQPGFRIISLNTNFCYKFNWWIMYKNNDPGNVLRWLVRELQKAEDKGEYVHIIAHIAPLYADCYEQWRYQFSRIVSRFSGTIRGQFYGHSHMTEVLLNYDVNDPKRPVGVQYLTPSNTPYHRLNPSYTLFYVDGSHPDSTRAVLDSNTYFLNLTAANAHDDVTWHLLYSARRDLSLRTLEAPDWHDLVRRMDKDPELTRKFHAFAVKMSDVLKDECDKSCRRVIVCNMVESDRFLPRKCKNSR